ncbi:MAG: TetR/AcrR family transcriptional regulator [Pseudomonadota bacterium]
MSTQSATALSSTPISSTAKGKTERTRDMLLAAGVRLFSQQGYEGTSTRQIETEAGVQRNLMTYHFGSKDAFWKACVEVIDARMNAMMAPAIAQSKDVEPRERIRFLIRRYVRASAAIPEISRIMFDEGRQKSWRLQYLVEKQSRSFFAVVKQMFEEGRKQGVIPDVPLINFYYLMVASATMFSMSAECEMLTGKKAQKESMIDMHADVMAKLLTQEVPTI